MVNENMVESIADKLVEDHVALMTEKHHLQIDLEIVTAERDTLLLDLSDFVGWFNSTYPAPSTHSDHPWNVVCERLQAYDERSDRQIFSASGGHTLQCKHCGWTASVSKEHAEIANPATCPACDRETLRRA